MEIKILNKKGNPLFKREEIEARLLGVSGPTPKRKDLIVETAKALGASEDHVIIDKIDSASTKEPLLKIFLYNKKEDIPKHVLDKAQKRIFGLAKKSPESATKPAHGA